ncbi:MAG: polysaccharide export protein [Planctomycetes bacterium]|nr:polysaccharide export protein [Planctomycetota bacterium]
MSYRVFTCFLLALAACQSSREWSVREAENLSTGTNLLGPNITAEIAAGEFFLGSGDVIDIDIWQEADLSRSYTVSSDGTFFAHLVGEVSVGGLSRKEARAQLTKAYSTYLVNPSIALTVTTSLERKVTVLGSVTQPGVYPLTTPRSSVLDLVARAGGIDAQGDSTGVVIARLVNGQTQVRALSLDHLFDPQVEAPEVVIPWVQPGDYVYILRTQRSMFGEYLRLVSETLRAIQWAERSIILAPDVENTLFSDES